MNSSRTGLWMGGAFVVSLALAALVLLVRGAGSDPTHTALRLTARWAYCFFWPAYTGGALAALFGARLQPVARRGRELGLAFAAAMLPHAALITWLYYISPHPPLPTHSAVFFAGALFFAYLLALFSIPRLFRSLPRPAWVALRTLGMEYIALAFLLDFLQNPFHHGVVNLLAYLPFIALAAAALLLRLCAQVKRHAGSRARHPAPAPTAAQK
jgi:peptidoglycan/LPS O-acetylase OafA/YrhL